MSSLELLQYTELDREKVLGTYGRTTVNVKQDIDNVKDWLMKQPHLPPAILDDKIIENFLIMNKFRVEAVKGKIDMYYTVRQLMPEYFDVNPNSSIAQTVMYETYVVPLPKLRHDLFRVILAFKLPTEDPNNFNVAVHTALTYHHIEMRLREDCSLGVIYIYDLGNAKSGHFLKISPQHVKKLMFVGERVLTTRIKEIHVINAPSVFDTFLSFLKKYSKPKIFSRIFVHKTMDTLYEMLPKEILPKDYGGQEKSVKELTDEWKETFLKYNSIFEHLRKLKVNEELRPGKPLENDILGIQGNFRKLEID